MNIEILLGIREKIIALLLLVMGCMIVTASLTAGPMNEEGNRQEGNLLHRGSQRSMEETTLQNRRAEEKDENDLNQTSLVGRGDVVTAVDSASLSTVAEESEENQGLSIEELTACIRNIYLADHPQTTMLQKVHQPLAVTEVKGPKLVSKKILSIVQTGLKYPLIYVEKIVDAENNIVHVLEAAANHLVVTLPPKQTAEKFLEQLACDKASLVVIPRTGNAERQPLYLLDFGVTEPFSMLAMMPLILEKMQRLFPKGTAELDLLYRENKVSDKLGSDLKENSTSLSKLVQKSVRFAWDAIRGHSGSKDQQGYGTQVALNAVKEANAVQQKVKLMDCKWLNERREGFYSDALSALYYGLDHGAQKYICHWNFTEPNQRYALNRAFNLIRVRGGEIISDPQTKIFQKRESGEKVNAETVLPLLTKELEKVDQEVDESEKQNLSSTLSQEVVMPRPGDKVMESHDCQGPEPGYKGRVTIIKTDLKYPVIRVEDIFNDQGVLVRRFEMAADHLLLRLPQGETPNSFLKKLEKVLPKARLNEVPWSEGPLYQLDFGACQISSYAAALYSVKDYIQKIFPTTVPEVDILYRGKIPNADYTKFWTAPKITKESGDKPSGFLPGERMILGVLDTGINPDFENLSVWYPSENKNIYGWNAIDGNSCPRDDHGHGTHCAAIITQDAGAIADQISLLACKWLNARREGFYSDAISSVYYACKNGASILNCSWVFPDMGERTELNRAFSYAKDKDCLVVLDIGEVSQGDIRPVFSTEVERPSVEQPAAESSEVAESQNRPLGLTNNGNDCFMNASLQLAKGIGFLSSEKDDVPMLKQFFNNNPSLDCLKLRQELARKVMIGHQEFDRDANDSVSNIFQSGSSLVQKDAAAFLDLLLNNRKMDQIHFSEKLIHPQTGEERMVAGGLKPLILPLTLPTIQEGEASLTLQEILDRSLTSTAVDYCWVDKDLSSRVDVLKKAQLCNSAPSCIVVSLGRFKFEGDVASKREDMIQGLFDQVAITHESAGNIFYQVNAIICHIGPRVNEGHYICYRKEGEKWFCFDDNKVSEVVMKGEIYQQICKNSYLLLLKKISLP